MLQQSIYNKLKKLCDDYYAAQAEAQKIVDNFNQPHCDDERNSLCEKLNETNEKINTYADEFSKEIMSAVNDLCNDTDDAITEHMKQKVLSPFDTSADNSRYNRINRLRELDEYVDSIKD